MGGTSYRGAAIGRTGFPFRLKWNEVGFRVVVRDIATEE